MKELDEILECMDQVTSDLPYHQVNRLCANLEQSFVILASQLSNLSYAQMPPGVQVKISNIWYRAFAKCQGNNNLRDLPYRLKEIMIENGFFLDTLVDRKTLFFLAVDNSNCRLFFLLMSKLISRGALIPMLEFMAPYKASSVNINFYMHMRIDEEYCRLLEEVKTRGRSARIMRLAEELRIYKEFMLALSKADVTTNLVLDQKKYNDLLNDIRRSRKLPLKATKISQSPVLQKTKVLIFSRPQKRYHIDPEQLSLLNNSDGKLTIFDILALSPDYIALGAETTDLDCNSIVTGCRPL